MIGRKLFSFLRRNPLPESNSAKLLVEEPKSKTWARRLISGSLICLTGGVALSALDDLAIFYAFSRTRGFLDNYRRTSNIWQ